MNCNYYTFNIITISQIHWSTSAIMIFVSNLQEACTQLPVKPNMKIKWNLGDFFFAMQMFLSTPALATLIISYIPVRIKGSFTIFLFMSF